MRCIQHNVYLPRRALLHLAVEQGGEEEVKPKRSRRAKTAPAELPPVEGAEGEEEGEDEEKPKKKRRGKAVDPNAFGALPSA